MRRRIPAIRLPLSAEIRGVPKPTYVTEHYVTNGHYMVRKDLLCKPHREIYAAPGCHGTAPPDESRLVACFPRGDRAAFVEFRPSTLATVQPDGRTCVVYVSEDGRALLLNREYIYAFPGLCERFYCKPGDAAGIGWGAAVPDLDCLEEPLPPFAVMPCADTAYGLGAVSMKKLAGGIWR